jgi:hypothetical protein
MARLDFFPRITIHSDYYKRRFLAKQCTPGYIFASLITILYLVLPFFTTFYTGHFWPKTATSQEQPLVTFKNKLYMELLFLDEQ